MSRCHWCRDLTGFYVDNLFYGDGCKGAGFLGATTLTNSAGAEVAFDFGYTTEGGERLQKGARRVAAELGFVDADGKLSGAAKKATLAELLDLLGTQKCFTTQASMLDELQDLYNSMPPITFPTINGFKLPDFQFRVVVHQTPIFSPEVVPVEYFFADVEAECKRTISRTSSSS